MVKLLSKCHGGTGGSSKVDALKDGVMATSFVQHAKCKCYRCGKVGHITKNCPEGDDDDEGNDDDSRSTHSSIWSRLPGVLITGVVMVMVGVG